MDPKVSDTDAKTFDAKAFDADTKVRVTANGGNFTAGKVRLIVYFIEMAAPLS